MAISGQIKIGPSFFTKIKSDYINWRFAFAREFCQNSGSDCGSTAIDVTITCADDVTTVTVTNDGRPMTEHELLNKLLALGESGKNFQGTTGGFGRAKELLYFSALSYQIHTGTMFVDGCGASYELTTVEHRHGTRSTVKIDGNEVNELVNQFKRCIVLGGWRGTFTINGEVVGTRLNKGALRRDFDWCKIHTNKSYEGLMVVRLGDAVMFTRPVRFKGCVVVSMDGESVKFLQSSRDCLLYQYQNELDNFVNSIASETKSAFRQKKEPKRSVYDGYRLAGKAKATATMVKEVELHQEVLATFIAKGENAALVESSAKLAEKVNTIASNVSRMEFHIKSETDMEIAPYYLPENFSDYSRTLAERWASILIELAFLEMTDKPFSVGYIFTDDRIGECETRGGQTVLFVNPITITERAGKPRSMGRRWVFNNDGNWDLVATGIHEFVHFLGYDSHDEDYAGKITELMGKVLANRERFGAIFCGRGKIKWPK